MNTGEHDYDLPFPQYRCPICGKDLPLTDARLTITCAEHQPSPEPVTFSIRPATAQDQHEVELLCDRAIGETDVDVFDSSFDVLAGENFLAEAHGGVAGLISCAVVGGELAIVLLTVYPEFQGRGIGGALVAAAVEHAATKGLPFVKATTTNDDIPLFDFYQRKGFVIYEIAIGAITDRIGGHTAGFGRIPMRDEIRLRRPVAG